MRKINKFKPRLQCKILYILQNVNKLAHKMYENFGFLLKYYFAFDIPHISSKSGKKLVFSKYEALLLIFFQLL